MVRQMIQKMSSLCRFAVPMALVPVKMAMADGMILESTIGECSNNSKALLSRLFRFQLILFQSAILTFLLSLDLSHFETEVGHRCLSKTHHLNRSLSSHKHQVSRH